MTRTFGLFFGCAALAGCGAGLPMAWEPGPPVTPSACRVLVEQSDAMGSVTLERHYDERGRVLYGATRLRYHGRAWERFEYDALGRLRAIQMQEEIAAESFPCDAEGGCDTPPLHVITRVRVGHDDAGRITEWALGRRTLEPCGESWCTRVSEENVVHYAYDASGRLIEQSGSIGTSHLRYEGDALVRVDRDAHYPWFRTLERDAEGRVIRLVHQSCTPEHVCAPTADTRYAYDAEGRVARSERSDPSRPDLPSQLDAFTYEGESSRVVHVDRMQGGSARTLDYAYDSLGRLVESRADGRLRETRRYEGACDAVTTGPQAPSAVRDAGGGEICHMSPGYVLDTCFVP